MHIEYHFFMITLGPAVMRGTKIKCYGYCIVRLIIILMKRVQGPVDRLHYM